jgi:hypothetical protein
VSAQDEEAPTMTWFDLMLVALYDLDPEVATTGDVISAAKAALKTFDGATVVA